MIKIGILLIATGRYINIVEQLYKSYEQHFLPNYSKKYLLYMVITMTNLLRVQ